MASSHKHGKPAWEIVGCDWQTWRWNRFRKIVWSCGSSGDNKTHVMWCGASIAGTKRIAKWLGARWTAEDCLGAENPRSIPFGFVWKWGTYPQFMVIIPEKVMIHSRFGGCFPDKFRIPNLHNEGPSEADESWFVFSFTKWRFLPWIFPLLSTSNPSPWPISPYHIL